MKVVLVFVSSLDGKITRWGDSNVRAWSSEEDQSYYKQLREEASLIVMGSKTFNRDHIQLAPGKLFVILTSDPDKYKHMEEPGLEFNNLPPARLIEQLSYRGYESMLLVGGAHVATSYLKAQLVDEVWLTIEPKVFGNGSSFVSDDKIDIDLQLISCEQVNDRGTLMTRYAVKK